MAVLITLCVTFIAGGSNRQIANTVVTNFMNYKLNIFHETSAKIKNSARFKVFTALLLETHVGYYLPRDTVSYSDKPDSTQNNL